MNEMIERVARAITKYPDKPKEWEEYSPIAHEIFRTIARLAIEAMREPTKEMIEAYGDVPYFDDCEKDAPLTWHAMIDAALK